MGRKIKKYIVILCFLAITGIGLKMTAHLGDNVKVYAKNITKEDSKKNKNGEKKKKRRAVDFEKIDVDKEKERETEKKDDEKIEDTEKEGEAEKKNDEKIEDTEKKKEKELEEESETEDNEEELPEYDEQEEDITFISNEIIKQVEEVELYQISYNEPDGKNGYYIKKPQVSLRHISQNGITKYRTMNGIGDKQEGILDKVGMECVVSERFMEGKNVLEVWMEDTEGNLIEASESRLEFAMDMLNPKVKISVPQGFRAWYPQDVPLSVEAEDGARGSQIAEIQCKIGEKVIGSSENSTAQFLITEQADKGQGIMVRVIVTDHAGNRTELADRVCIDKVAPVTEIDGVQDYLITSKPVKVTYRAKEENRMKELQAGISHEDEKGNTTQQNIATWEENGKEKLSAQTLSKNGIYKLQIQAEDMAGNQSKIEKQVIIDQDNPVIMHVEELNGQYMKEFQWQYESGEWIQDFTSYTYLMQLDDELYKPGEKITKEGTHTLRVSAEDAAGNTGEAKAKFVIDHTPPVIRFENVSEGEVYEKERKVKIVTEKKEDYIETVKINGKEQKLKKKNAESYECKLEEEKEYEIEVVAKDLAQNESVSRVSFRIGAEKSILQKIIDPVQKKILGEKDEEGNEKQKKMNRKKGVEKYFLWMVTGIVIVGGAGILGYRNREYLKKLLKK